MSDLLARFQAQTRRKADSDLIRRWEWDARYHGDKNIKIQGTYVGSVAMFEAMNRAIALHRMTPVVDRVFSFDDAVAALKYLQSGNHFGKVVITL